MGKEEIEQNDIDSFSKERVTHTIKSKSTIKGVIQTAIKLNTKYKTKKKYDGETPTEIIENACAETFKCSRIMIRRAFYVERHGNSQEKELLYSGNSFASVYKRVHNRICDDKNRDNEKNEISIEDALANEIVLNINKIKEDFEKQMEFWKNSIKSINSIKAKESVAALDDIIRYFENVRGDINKWANLE